MNRGIKGNLAAVLALTVAALSADTATPAHDTKEFDAFGYLVQVGAMAFDASNKIALELLHSDDNSTFTACDLSDYEGGAIKELAAAADASKVHAVGYVGSKRYVKLNLNVTGTVSVATSVIGISTAPKSKPAI